MLGNKLIQAAAGNAGGEVDEYFNQTTLLLHGDGTNGAQNNTFLDSSTNNFTITRNGNTTQGTFSPFSAPDGRWGNYIPGSGSILYTGVNTALSFDANFTIEGWFYFANFANASGGGNPGLIGYGTNNWVLLCPGGEYVFYAGGSIIFETTTVGIIANKWHHFALVRSGSTITMYHNGVSVATATNSSTLNIGSSGVTVGSNGINGVGAATGYVSNIRVVKGTAVYTSAFTPPTEPLAAIANTQLLVCQSNRFKDNSSNNFSVTIQTGPSVQPFSPFAPSAAYSTSVNGGSGYFDGSGDYLEVAASASLDLGTSSFTYEFWWYPTVSQRQSFLCSATDYWFGLDYQTAGQGLGLWASSTGTSWDLINADPSGNGITSASPKFNSWNHVAVSRSSGSWSVWLNGSRVLALTGITSSVVSRSAENKRIGRWAAAYGFYAAGYLSNNRLVIGSFVYDPSSTTITIPTAPATNISNTQFLLNYTNAGIFDNTSKNNLETVGNAQIDTATKKYGTGSMEFDGTDDRLVMATSPNYAFGTGDFTIEAWVNSDNVSTPSERGYLQTSASVGGLSTSYTGGVAIYFGNPGNGAVRVLINGTGFSTSAGAISTGTWFHIALTRQSGTCTIWINGASSATTTNAANLTAQNLCIGGYYSTSYLYDGYLDDLRITKGVARYTTTFTPPTAPFPNQ